MTNALNSARREQISAALARRPDLIVEETVALWQKLAPELVSIIGEGGFRPLYSRSVRLVGARFPWLLQGPAMPSGAADFSELSACMGTQPSAEATLASESLFTVFLDMLASLIGDALTDHILSSAWSLGTPDSTTKVPPP